ncbi:MAG: oligosaccharide flippase family protein [Candidatus Muirbacterium halophilum]|nr:oligosaccharide flippase family protein [Candidatus Muirbacterium halophilum]MCK9477182.1 oligosaccharide flippase family protein [Candidatus Muirbacterium halophilum]
MLKILPDNLKTLLNHKVVKAGSWYTLTEFFLKGVAFLTIPIFTRLLSTADYGIVALYQAWVSIFTILITLDLKVSIGRAKFDFKETYNQYVSSVAFLSLIIFFIFLIIFLLFTPNFLNLTQLSPFLFFLMVFQAYFLFIQNYAINKFRFEYKYKLVSILSILVVISGILFSIYLIINIFETNKYLGQILGKSSFIIFGGFCFLLYLFYQGKEFINYKYWKYALALSIPMVFHSISRIINDQFDRILINKYVDTSSTGIYSFAYNIGVIVTVLLAATAQAWVPWFYEKMEKKEYLKIKYNANIYRNIFTYVYAGILFLSPELIRIMAQESYWQGLNLIPWIFMAGYFNFMCNFELNTQFFMKKMSLVSLGTILSAIVNIILNIIFIPKYGYEAAAITTVISFLFLFLFHYIITTKILKKVIYGIKFHLVSIFYVSTITILFILFQNLLFARLILIIIFSLFFFFSLKSSLAKSD